MSLPEEAYNKLDLIISTAGNLNEIEISLERGFIGKRVCLLKECGGIYVFFTLNH